MNSSTVNKYNGWDILIVDDTPVNLRALAHILTKEGYKVRKALNGKMALTACQTTIPDLILLDILMPELDGYEVCSLLKADEKTREIPVIFLSALDTPSDKAKAYNAGGIDYISKPFQVEEVLARVATQLRLQQLKRQLAEREAEIERLNRNFELYYRKVEKFTYLLSQEINSLLLPGKFVDDSQADLFPKEGAPVFETIDCIEVLKVVRDNLSEKIAASGVRINYSHSQLPIVKGARSQLIKLFQTLIEILIQFRPPNSPEIFIFAEANNEQCLFGIRNSGGSDTISNQKSDSLLPLSLNLNLCKEIVERHGGQIWMDFYLPEGSTFYFTLPAAIISQ